MKTTLPSTTSLLRDLSSAFREKGFSEPEKEAELLVCHALGVSRAGLYRDALQADDNALQVLDSLLRRRLCREPIEYVTGCAEFHGLRFRVGRGVLIPRPETEILVEEAVRILNSWKTVSPVVLDLCTGSGCIATAIAREVPSARVVASDVSALAMRYARENARLNGAGNVVFVQGDLFDPLEGQSFNMIVSNPPYVKEDDLAGLQVEVRDYEPVEALDGGRDGLDFYRRILSEAPQHLKEKGCLVLELGLGQSGSVGEIAGGCGLKVVKVLKDLSGIDRVMVLERFNRAGDKRLLEAM